MQWSTFERTNTVDVAPNAAEADIVIVDRRALWRHALTATLAAVWSDVTFRTVDTRAVGAAIEPGDASAAVVLGGIGFAENAELREDLKTVTATLPATPILLLTDRVDAADVADAIKVGAKGYLESNVALAVLIQSLRLLMIGGTAFPGILPCDKLGTIGNTRAMQPATMRREEGTVSPVGLFTPKELEVLSGLGEGKPNKIIAYELDICETTVKVHMRHIMRKLGATNRTHAALLASEMFTSVN